MSTNTLVFGLFEYDPETDGNLPFNVTQALNNNWDKIDSLVLPSATVAAPYNPSGTYSIGDFCIYNGTLEQCNTDIPDGETWNAAHWTNVSLTQLLSPLGGATTSQAVLVVLGAGTRDNELDNPYFVGGGTGWGVFPVNQRGVSGTISTPGYFIDRWKLVSGTVEIIESGLVLNGTIEQILPSSIGSVYTATALTTTGIVTCQYDDAIRTFTITGTGQTFVFSKLEKGLGQTAAYQDSNGAWNQLQQPDENYATQLMKCKNYATIIGTGVPVRLYADYITENALYISVPINAQLRNVNPTIVSSNSLSIFSESTQTGFSFSAYNTGNCLIIAASKPNHGLSSGMLQMQDVLLSCDL